MAWVGITFKGRTTDKYYSAWQSFKQTTGASKPLQSIKAFFGGSNISATIYCQLYASNKTTLVGTAASTTITLKVGELATFDFVGQGLSIATETVYWVKFYTGTITGAYGGLNIFYNPTSFTEYYEDETEYEIDIADNYANGEFNFEGSSTDAGDLYFHIVLSGGYYKSTGYIRTQTMDMGATPSGNGEWSLDDIRPTGTNVTCEAWASATGAFAGEETALGVIVDGGAITNLKRYYRVKATLTANGDQSLSPQVNAIRADFVTATVQYSNHPALGYEPALMSVSSLSTSIDTFKPSTIGQITLTFSHCQSVSNYLATKKPKNKIVKIKAGFVADGFVEADYIDYFWGQIDDWNISGKDEIIINVKDYSKEWDVTIPVATSSGLPTITWLGWHPIDVMLDLLKNHINARDSKIVGSSFETVKAAIPGWVVNRVLKKDTISAKDAIEELRRLTSCYFLPQSNGRIKLKRWNADEAF